MSKIVCRKRRLYNIPWLDTRILKHRKLSFNEIKGTHGSGKSSIPFELMADTPYIHLLDGNGKVAATLLPERGVVMLGKYDKNNTTGGCDKLPSLDYVEAVIRWLWLSPWHIVAEGILMTNARWRTLYCAARCVAETEGIRTISTTFLQPPIETCLARIQKRNAGKPIKEDIVRKIHMQAANSIREVAACDFTWVTVSETGEESAESTAERFYNRIRTHVPRKRVKYFRIRNKKGLFTPNRRSPLTKTDEELLGW